MFGFSMSVLELDSPRMLRETMNRGNGVSLFKKHLISLNLEHCFTSCFFGVSSMRSKQMILRHMTLQGTCDPWKNVL